MIVGDDDGIHHLLKVTVLEIDGGTVKLGFEVNAGVPVLREEACEPIHDRCEPGIPTVPLTAKAARV